MAAQRLGEKWPKARSHAGMADTVFSLLPSVGWMVADVNGLHSPGPSLGGHGSTSQKPVMQLTLSLTVLAER